jgi:hypothetical protein
MNHTTGSTAAHRMGLAPPPTLRAYGSASPIHNPQLQSHNPNKTVSVKPGLAHYAVDLGSVRIGFGFATRGDWSVAAATALLPLPGEHMLL